MRGRTRGPSHLISMALRALYWGSVLGVSAVSCCPAPQASPERIRPRSRPIGVGCPAVLAALIMLALLAACTEVDGAAPSPPGPGGSGSAEQSIPGADPRSSTGSLPPATTPLPAEPGTPASGPTDELPYDPIQRTVTGIVERTGGCTVLVTGTRRWALTGDLANSLNVGGRMTVTGNLTQLPPSCTDEVGPGLQVTGARPA